MVRFLDLEIGQLERKLEANVVSQVAPIKAVLPSMLATGSDVIVDVSSHVATADPPAPVGKGGWGLAYAASKAAFHRIAPLLAVELGDEGISAYNVDPGYVDTERQLVNAPALGISGRYAGAPPSVPAAVIAWLATSPHVAATVANGGTALAQRLALDLHLHPAWRRRYAGFGSAEPLVQDQLCMNFRTGRLRSGRVQAPVSRPSASSSVKASITARRIRVAI
jgi:NAD(P)-dependent dehydrogenase (short-subunit alcohol dehydrogenase family)